jgi:hypothetical protein
VLGLSGLVQRALRHIAGCRCPDRCRPVVAVGAACRACWATEREAALSRAWLAASWLRRLSIACRASSSSRLSCSLAAPPATPGRPPRPARAPGWDGWTDRGDRRGGNGRDQHGQAPVRRCAENGPAPLYLHAGPHLCLKPGAVRTGCGHGVNFVAPGGPPGHRCVRHIMRATGVGAGSPATCRWQQASNEGRLTISRPSAPESICLSETGPSNEEKNPAWPDGRPPLSGVLTACGGNNSGSAKVRR